MSVAAPRGEGAHRLLRSGTARAHAGLDARFGRYDLGDPEGYRAFLTAHARALPAVEAALDAAGMADLLDDWPMRRRAALIAQDLAMLGDPMPAPLPFAPLPDADAAWGAAYVVEGSRLGGSLLARRVHPDAPRAYLATPLPAGAWRKFLAKLDESLYSAAMDRSAIPAALATFALFEAAAA